MKRATLTAYPTALPSEPIDLTDRLLQSVEDPVVARPAQRGRKQRRDRKTQPDSRPAPTVAAPTMAEPPAPPVSGLDTALAATETATAALRQAAREAPARYDVALHYRLDALAHHLQQVTEFVANLTAR
jgi:hypothetical protein